MPNLVRNVWQAIPWGLIRYAVLLPAGLWMVVVLLPSLLGSPGVICITPVGWLLGLWVGLRVTRVTDVFEVKTHNAALAGGLLGLIQGVAFIAIALLSPDFSPGEVGRSVLLGLIVTLLGTGVSAGLAAWVGRLITGRGVTIE
jgi:hypothetical protein